MKKILVIKSQKEIIKKLFKSNWVKGIYTL